MGKERAENSGAAAAAGSKLDILMPTSEQVLVVLIGLWHLLLYFYVSRLNGTHHIVLEYYNDRYDVMLDMIS